MTTETHFRFRQIDWARDQIAIESFDTSFTTDRIYELETADLSMRFVERRIGPPLTKKYDTSGIAVAVTESHLPWRRRRKIT